MVLQNLSARVVQIPPKTVKGNVQMAEVVPNLKVFEQTSMVPLQKEWVEQSKLSCPNRSNSPEKELTQPTPKSLQSGPNVPTPEHDVLVKVTLLGCAEQNPSDQQELRKILEE